MYKTFVLVIEKQVKVYVEEKDLLGDFQGAFHQDRRCEDNIFCLKGICAIRRSKKLKMYLAFIDISKAFDTVKRPLLFAHLWSQGIQGKIWKVIRALYARVDNKVIFGSFESDPFQVLNGVKQGCVLSPCLFNIVIADLDSMLGDQDGIHINGHKIHGLYYADDIILISDSENSLQNMLDVAANFAEKWGLSYNDTKSKVMVIGKRIKDRGWALGDKWIYKTNSYCYLGVFMNRSLKDSYHINSHITKKADKMDPYMRYTLAKHHDIKRIELADTIWQKIVLPSLTHGAGVWFADTKSSKDKLSSIQYRFAKAALKIKTMPSASATIGELGWRSTEY